MKLNVETVSQERVKMTPEKMKLLIAILDQRQFRGPKKNLMTNSSAFSFDYKILQQSLRLLVQCLQGMLGA